MINKDSQEKDMVWMQDAVMQTGKSRWWIIQRCTVYKREYLTRWRSYVRQGELDQAMATYRAEVDVYKEVRVPTKKTETAHVSA